MALCRQHHIGVLTAGSTAFPPLLREIPDPPPVLFLKGDITPADGTAVAVVGSRHATSYGRQQAERLGRGLAQTGYTVVSGLARGVDAAAHRGALAAGGRTLAVLGNGLARIYPPEHAELAIEVSHCGALLSESLPGDAPHPKSFPKRNRLISGLSLGVVVVEAAERSGALITARHATEQNREVFAVPGRVDNRMARGPHRLIRDGARLVESVDDVLEELESVAAALRRPAPTLPACQTGAAPPSRSPIRPALAKLDDVERQVFAAVETEATHVDEVIRRSGAPAHVVLATMTTLEVRRLVRRVDGGRWMRVD
ncbi:MAG: DNA-processing protein DprA [Pirellulales bacterium]